ncbi:hypothetical protein ACD661_13205 [Legionella lytica]|uniref:Uncharacterized protein n=1 Tax=Legionella lytica TaxID=96232 RepID=A0ABW8DA12_9GAMM
MNNVIMAVDSYVQIIEAPSSSADALLWQRKIRAQNKLTSRNLYIYRPSKDSAQ